MLDEIKSVDEAGMMSPHVAYLQQAVPLISETNEGLHFTWIECWGFFQMKVTPGIQNFSGETRVLRDFGFDQDDFCPFKNLCLSEDGDSLGPVLIRESGCFGPSPEKLVICRLAQEAAFFCCMRIGESEKTGSNLAS